MNLSKQLFHLAQQYIPGGVNSPVRAFRGVDGEPLFIKNGRGAYLTDVDERILIDYVCSWGPLIAGHAHPKIVEQVTQAVQNGMSFGAPTEIETRLAQKICEYMPAIESIRFVNSGTEASMSAIRLARGFTKREKIIKFAGCYHGHADSLLVSAGSGGLTFGVPSSAGVPQSVVAQTLVAQYNSIPEVEALFAQHRNEIAAVIVEPVAGNMNLVLPQPHFLQDLRELCDRNDCLLIFDEVITGFRVALGGAQSYYNVKPDLTILGKIIGGGFPAAAFGGRSEIMHELAPMGPVYQAGTLSGNPIAMTAGLATLEIISVPGFYSQLEQKTKYLVNGLNACANALAIPFHVATVASMFGLFFTAKKEIKTEQDVKKCDQALFKQFFHGMLNAGIYLAPSAFEIGFVSAAHTENDIARTLRAAEVVLNGIKDKQKCALFAVEPA